MADLDNQSSDGGAPASGAVISGVTTTWTSTTVTGTALSISVIGFGTVVASGILTGSLSGTIWMQASTDNGVNWDFIEGVQTDNSGFQSNIYNPGTGTGMWQFNVAGFTNFRWITNAALTGAGSLAVRIQAFSFPATTVVTPIQQNGYQNHVVTDSGSTTVVTGNVSLTPSTLAITATAATGVAVTATLPAVAGQFHYLTSIHITKYFTLANAASATPLLVTTTNLPGSIVFTFGQPLGTIGSTDVRQDDFSFPFKSSVVNTNTTIVCPATTGIIWRVNVIYYAAT